jgi:hypothetical protein
MGFSFLAYNYLVFSLTATAISLVIGLMLCSSSIRGKPREECNVHTSHWIYPRQ